MTALSIQPTYPIFTDIDGQPLDSGYVYIGQANLDPQGNPINVYWDAALTQLAAQPIRTLNGYPSNSGTPARLYVGSDYSIRVMNKKASTVYNAPTATERFSAVVVSDVDSSQVTYTPAGTGAVATTVQQQLRNIQSWQVNVKDAPFYAKGDGITDDTAAIQAAVNAISLSVSGFYDEVTGKTLLFPAGVYKITAPVSVPQNAGISFVGEGKTKSTIFQATANTDIFTLSGNNYRGVFKGLRLTGPQGQVGGSSKAINVTSSGNQIYVEDCWINTMGYAIYGNPSSDSNFLNNVIEYVLTPIYMGGAGNGYFIVQNNIFYNCGPVSLGAFEQRASFEFQSTTNLIFTNNRIVSDSAMSPQSDGVFVFNNVTRAVFSNNVFNDGTYAAQNFKFTSCSGIKFESNILPKSNKQQLIVSSCSDVVVSGNTFPTVNNPGALGFRMVEITGTSNMRFQSNYVGQATMDCVWVNSACSSIHIVNNVFDGGCNINLYKPIDMHGTTSAVISGNIFKSATGNTNDIAVDTTTGLILDGNTLLKGYYIDPGVAPAHVFGNTGSDNRTYLNAAPIYGTWKVGDRVWFETPTAGGNIGAVCVTAGAPGTWKTFGAIAA